MTRLNPYRAIASEYSRLLQDKSEISPEMLSPPAAVEIPPHAPKVLLFSPHPDDECLVGALPLRLLRELKMRVINVAVTQGSNKDRQQERWQELQEACDYLGFGLVPTQDNGLERVNRETREGEPELWQQSVSKICQILDQHRPKVIFFPHDRDWNSTHIGTHYLVMDALAKMEARFSCWLVETEYWGAMESPNLAIASSPEDLGDLMAATAFHVGEVRRNPYHLRLPAWMMDNVRRGSELVGGQGETAPNITFATLYRLSRWRGERWHFRGGGRIFTCEDDLQALFG